MELSKQASRQWPSASPQSASQDTPYPDNRAARVPISEYLIVPMSSGQASASARPSAANLPKVSRVSLRLPQQVMNVQAASPGTLPSQPSPPSAMGKEMAASLKVQTLKPVPSDSKCSVQKEPLLEGPPQSCESVRAKFRETLAAALGMDSHHPSGQQSASNVSPLGPSAGENKHADAIDVGASESTSKRHSERDLDSDTDAGAFVSPNKPESKRPKTSDEVTGEKKWVIQNVQILPFRIEAELFKLFGGVNRKYKEKGRSLLFNLKDKSNPALRERVLSGDITPKFLCSMTTEELASKELSAWRLAKAEELAKMVVLPNGEMDVRRLVRKNHKGEFHVEVEESDGTSVEVELGGDLLSHVSKFFEGQTKSGNRANLHRGFKESDNNLRDEVGGKGNSYLQSNLQTCLAKEKADPVQDCMVDGLKDTEILPGITSPRRFTEALHSKVHYEDHSTETAEDAFPNNADIRLKQGEICITDVKAAQSEFGLKCDASSPKEKCRSKIESPKNVSVLSLCQVKPKGDMLIKASSKMMASEKLDTGSCSVSILGDTKLSIASPDATLAPGSLWEGTIQFTLSSHSNVVAIFKSGEKPSTKDWCHFVEIKGTVKLTAFQEFLEQLPNSRRRTVTVTELRWKEDSLESGRQHLLQAIDSYIADESVGLMKPAEGVDVYLCPSHGTAAQILAEHLPKEHLGSLSVIGDASVIGVMVWRRNHGSTRISTRHDGSNWLSVSKKRQAVIASSVPIPSLLTKPPGSHFIHSNEHHRINDDDVSDAVRPGFGHCGVKHDDDLPEFNFVSVSNTSSNVATSHTSRSQQHVPAISPPPDRVRQLVHKYGDSYVSAEPWDGNNDDLWPPDQVRQPAQKYGNSYVADQTWDDNDDDDLRPPDQVRQLVHKYGKSYVSAQPWDGDNDGLRPLDPLRQLVHKYGNDDDLRPPDQVRQLVRKYGNRYSAHPWAWDGRTDDLPELYWDPIQSSHQRTRHPQPLMSLTEHYRQRDDYYHRHHQLQEHYDEMLLQQHRAMATPQLTSPMPQFYVGPEQHGRTVHGRRNYQSLMHPAETLGWRSGTEQQFAGVPIEAVTPMQDVVRQSYFGVEPDMVAPRSTSLLGTRRPWLGPVSHRIM